jgi:hypothetical protein
MGFSKEASMNKPVLLAALAAALPVHVLAQEAGPGAAAPQRDCAAGAELPPASGALPARASTKPEPQLGTVAPNTRVPSQADTPSMRAMRTAGAREAGRVADTAAGVCAECAPATDHRARQGEKKR